MIEEDIPFEDVPTVPARQDQGGAHPTPQGGAERVDATTDAIEAELDALQAQFAENERAEQESREQWRQQQRLEIRERLRRGDLPSHFISCRTCGRAILALRFQDACEAGKGYKGLIF